MRTGFSGMVKDDWYPAEQYLAPVKGVYTSKTFRQGRFSRTIFTYQSMHFTG
jgi:hypothetical protein